MIDNKVIIEQIPNAEVANLSQASVPQMGISARKAPVPAITADSPKVKETASSPEAKDPYLVANIQATEPLTENSTLFDSFGPDAVNFVSIGMAEMAAVTDKPFTLKTTLKEAFGENVPYVLKILLEDQAAMKKAPAGKLSQKSPNTKPAAPKVVKKVIITKAGAQAIAEVKKMDSKSTLEEVFGPEMAAKIVNSVKTEAISQITKSTTIRHASVAEVQAAATKKTIAAKTPTIPTKTVEQKAAPSVGAAKTPTIPTKTVEQKAAPSVGAAKTPTIPTKTVEQKAAPSLSVATPKQLATKPTNKKLTHYIPVKKITENITKPIPAPGKPGLFILPKNPMDISHMRSDGKQLFPGHDQPWDEWSPEEQAKFDAELEAELEAQHAPHWKSVGIDIKDKAAQRAWIKANPDARYVEIKQNLIDRGLPTTSFVPLGYFESLSDKTINKFLLGVATIYTFYNYPITIYYAIGLAIFSWIIAFLVKYSRILERLKHDFVPDPKSPWSEAFQRDAHRRMRAYISKKTPKQVPIKSAFKKK